jgi:hypothetical protein
MIMPENWRLGWLGPAVPRRRAWEAAPLPDRAGGDSAIGRPNEELSPNFPGTCIGGCVSKDIDRTSEVMLKGKMEFKRA